MTNAYGTTISALATLTVNVAPGITTPPADVTVTAPAPAAFSVVASGDAPLSYQWRRNGTDIPGATSASYTLDPTAGSDTGATFDVVVTNAYGTTTSALATLTVNVAPSVTTPPADVTVTAPAPAAFSVVASGDAPLSYQWRRNGTDIPSATGATYVLDPTAAGDTGATFDVVVTNAYGTTTSALATLTVNVAPGITTPPADVTVTAPAPAAFSVVAAGDAPLSYQWRRNGTDIPGATSASYTLDPTAGGDTGATFDVVVTNAYGTATSAAATLTVHLAPGITTQPADLSLTEPAPATFSVVATGDSPLSYQWRRDGADIPGAAFASYTLDPTALSDSGATFDVVVTNAFGSATSATATLTVGAAPVPPSITANPTSLTVTATDPAAFTVVATGDAPLSYQWRRNGTNISGATSASYTLAPTAVGDTGAQFDVIVTNAAGSATSAPATLTVLPNGVQFSFFGNFARYPATDGGSSSSSKTVAIAPPASMTAGQLAVVFAVYRSTATLGQTVDVSAAGGQTWTSEPAFLSASGKTYVRVFWTQFNGTWSANPSFLLNTGNGASANAFTLYGMVFNVAGDAFVDVPMLSMELGSTAALSHGGITTATDNTLVIGGFVQPHLSTFSGWTAGWTNPNGETQWRNTRGDDSVIGVAYKTMGAAGPTGALSATSSFATESVAFMLAFHDPPAGAGIPTPPSIDAQPADSVVTAPGPAAFSVVASGDAPLSYQWRRGGIDIPGATSATYTLDPTAISDSGAQLDVVVTNGAGTATSAPALLTVNALPAPPTIDAQPGDVAVTAPAAATFFVVASGDSLAYQWRRDGAAIPGATGSSYTLDPTAVSDSGALFDVVVSNAGGTATSTLAGLTVIDPSAAGSANKSLTSPSAPLATAAAYNDLLPGDENSVAIWVAPTPSDSLLFVTQKSLNTVDVWNLQTNQIVQTITGLDTPNGVAVDRAEGALYVASQYEHAVHKYLIADIVAGDLSSTLIPSDPLSPSREPIGLTVYHNTSGPSLIYATYSGSYDKYVRAFDPDGVVQYSWSVGPIALGNIAADEDNALIYVADKTNDLIKVYRPDGTFVQDFGQGDFAAGSDVEGTSVYRCGNDGYILASDQKQDEFEIYDRLTFAHLATFTVSGVSNTIGLTLVQSALPGYPNGALFVQSNGDQVFGIQWDVIAAATGVSTCAIP